MLSRRGLLFTGSAAVALSMVGNRPLLATAAEEDRYTVILRQANELAESGPKFYTMPDFAKTDTYAEWCERGETLFRNLMRLFPEEADRALTQDLFDGKLSISSFDESSLRELVPGVAPIALIREMVQVRRLPFHMHRQPGFLEFAERHRHAVMT